MMTLLAMSARKGSTSCGRSFAFGFRRRVGCDILRDALVLFEVALPLPLLTRAVDAVDAGAAGAGGGGGPGGPGIMAVGGVLLAETAVWEVSEGVFDVVFSL